jgi:hypothetical protein
VQGDVRIRGRIRSERVATLKFRFTVKALITHEFNGIYLHVSINYNEKTMN